MEIQYRNIRVFIFCTIVITTMTWGLGILDFKYKHESVAAFQDGFPGDLDEWQPAGDWSNVIIGVDKITVERKTTNRSFAKRTFNLPEYTSRAEHKLRVRGVIETSQRVTSETDDKGAAYMVWLADSQGEVLKYLTVQNLTGEREKYFAERIISIPDSVSSFTLVLNSRDSTSSFSLLDASAEVISTTTYYQAVSVLLVFSWLLLLSLGGKWLFKHASQGLFAIVALLTLAIIVGVMLPESITTVYIDPLFQKMAGAIPTIASDSAEITYKIGHFLFFFFVAFVLMLKASTLPLSRTELLILLVLLAIASEGMQLHLFNRTTSLIDLVVDSSGIFLAWCVASLILSRSRST